MDEANKAIAELQPIFLNLIRMLVGKPEAVVLEARTQGIETAFHLQVAKSDVGKVIGKQGTTARSIRLLLTAASTKSSHRFVLNIDERGIVA